MTDKRLFLRYTSFYLVLIALFYAPDAFFLHFTRICRFAFFMKRSCCPLSSGF